PKLVAYAKKVLFVGDQKGYQRFNGNTLSNYVSLNTTKQHVFMGEYALSGAALADEEQAEDGNSIVYKTNLEEMAATLVVYPNPSIDNISIKITLSESEAAVATIYNYSGIVVKTISLTENETKVEIAELPAGMYFVEVVGNNFKEIRKIIKQ
ncbi:MAG: T9SS type A sorting domain-containing protein, partial [Bacteroidetes bacterium]|nr:T9SS type A sorting domain-containing protein [Bacteroidota bacterium]